MSEASKPTPGEWFIEKITDEAFDIYTDNVGIETVAELLRNNADAKLIAEAGTVFHETGLTPRELQKQRDSTLAALKVLHRHFLSQHGFLLEIGTPDFVSIRDQAEAAIAMCQEKHLTEISKLTKEIGQEL